MKTLNRRVQFLVNAVLGRGKVGAIMMSSRYVVRGVLKHIPMPPKTVIEYGPGDGVMTRALLRSLAPDGRLLAIELGDQFIRDLKRINDPRLTVINGKVQDVLDKEAQNFQDADLIVSSIPFSFLTISERDQVLEKTRNLLKPQGAFIVFHQYSTLMKKPLEKYFHKISISFEPRNILPCFILVAKKASKPKRRLN